MGTVEQFKPPSQDHVVKIQPDRDIILALDENGGELCRLAFEINGKTVHFRTPLIANYKRYCNKMAVLFSYLAQYAGEILIPEDKVNGFKDEFLNELYKKLTALATTADDKVIGMVEELFFEYLDGQIDGIDLDYDTFRATFYRWKSEKKVQKLFVKARLDHQKEWLRSNARMDEIQKLFSACLMVDDLLKKNAQFVLEKAYNLQPSKEQNLSPSSKKKGESTPAGMTPTQHYSFEPL